MQTKNLYNHTNSVFLFFLSSMKILNAGQIRQIEQYSITNEGITGACLMERAAATFCTFFAKKWKHFEKIAVICGTGNNGGDGLCIARILHQKGLDIQVFIAQNCTPTSDFTLNLNRLQKSTVPIIFLQPTTATAQLTELFALHAFDCCIDAMLGIGINKPIENTSFLANIITFLNQTLLPIIAVDVPSGLFINAHTPANSHVIQACATLTFHCPKLAFMFPQNYKYVGNWQVLPIQLNEQYTENKNITHFYFTTILAQKILPALRKNKFQHKGNNGHALIIGGSYGKIGAAMLASKAALKAGAGLVTAYTCACGYAPFQAYLPEIMTITNKNNTHINAIDSNFLAYKSIAVGMGMGTHPDTQTALKFFLENIPPHINLVLDADALNIISYNKWYNLLPINAILTPHPKEFERLVGKKPANNFESLTLQQNFAQQHKVILILKGAHTCTALPNGTCYFNSTGNPAMATAGSGDVLSGIIAGLLAQGLAPEQAAVLGVFLHAHAADKAVQETPNTTLQARELIHFFSRII